MVSADVARYMKAFKEKLCDMDKCPSDSTLKTYAYSMNWMLQRIEGFTFAKPADCDTILKYMNGNKVKSTRRLASYTALKVAAICLRIGIVLAICPVFFAKNDRNADAIVAEIRIFLLFTQK